MWLLQSFAPQYYLWITSKAIISSPTTLVDICIAPLAYHLESSTSSSSVAIGGSIICCASICDIYEDSSNIIHIKIWLHVISWLCLRYIEVPIISSFLPRGRINACHLSIKTLLQRHKYGMDGLILWLAKWRRGLIVECNDIFNIHIHVIFSYILWRLTYTITIDRHVPPLPRCVGLARFPWRISLVDFIVF